MQTFSKRERLSRKKIIDLLFEKGNKFWISPFKIVWMNNPEANSAPAQVLIVVPKQRIKKAVSRNLLKRRIREAYRKNKSSFYDFLQEHDSTCAFAVIYTYDEIAEYSDIEEKIILILQRLQKEYAKGIR